MYPNVALQTRKCSRNSSSLWRGTSVSHHDGARSRTQYSWTRRPPEAVRAVVLTATPAAIRAACVALSAACSDGGARRRYCGHHPAAVVDRHPSRRSGEKWRERPSARSRRSTLSCVVPRTQHLRCTSTTPHEVRSGSYCLAVHSRSAGAVFDTYAQWRQRALVLGS